VYMAIADRAALCISITTFISAEIILHVHQKMQCCYEYCPS
jgi:hypothetical protein